jgi:hypothetical protein
MDENLARCALINFENFARVNPAVRTHPMFRLAQAQLAEALGGPKLADVFKNEVERAASDALTPKKAEA